MRFWYANISLSYRFARRFPTLTPMSSAPMVLVAPRFSRMSWLSVVVCFSSSDCARLLWRCASSAKLKLLVAYSICALTCKGAGPGTGVFLACELVGWLCTSRFMNRLRILACMASALSV